MATSPFTPSRLALGDISNKKVYKSALKTPLARVEEEIERTHGLAYIPEIEEMECLRIDFGKSPLMQPHEFDLQVIDFSTESPEFSDEGFRETEDEINRYLNQGVNNCSDNIIL